MVEDILSSGRLRVVEVVGVLLDLFLGVDLLAFCPFDLIDHDALGVLDEGRGVSGIGIILLAPAQHLLLQHNLPLLLLLDLLSFLSVLV